MANSESNRAAEEAAPIAKSATKRYEGEISETRCEVLYQGEIISRIDGSRYQGGAPNC